MTALRLATRKDRRAWRYLTPRTPRPGSAEPRATACPYVRNPCTTKCETPSVGRADGNPRRGLVQRCRSVPPGWHTS
jgi:hypothetical protein